MPRIQIPQIDKPASRFDKVIGSDVDNASVTRNYQLGDILALFNSLSGGGIFSYRFTTALIDLDSIAGKMATVNGATDPDAVTSFRFSTSDLDEGDITSLAQNYEANSDSVVLKLTSESDPNLIAVYTITSVTATTNYVDIEVLQHKNFNSLTFVNHKDFTLSFDYVNIFGAASGATNTSQLTNDGEDGINPFITLEDILTDHTALSNIGTNTHEQIDVHISSTNIHYTQASISITESQISDLQTYLLNITGEPFGDLSDVVLTGVASGEIIKFTGTNWINNTLAEAGISGVGHGHAFSEITETPTTLSGYGISDTKVNFNIALSDGSFMFIGDAPTSHTHLEADITDLQAYLLNITSESIGDLSDVTIVSPTARQVLVNNGGGGWTNRDLVELDISDLTGRVEVSNNDTTRDYLEDKIIGGDGMNVSTLNDGGDEDIEIQLSRHYLSLASTGLYSGAELSIGATTGTFDITEGEGLYVDASTDFDNIEVKSIIISDRTNVTITNILTQPVTYISIDKNDNIIQSVSFPTPGERRVNIFIGVVVHSDNVNVNAINYLPSLSSDIIAQVYDRWNSEGDFFNISGNSFIYGGSNLTIDKSVGEIFKTSVNYGSTKPEKDNPHRKTLSLLSGATFRYRLRDSTEDPDTTNIDTDNYDLSGTKTTVPPNKYTIQRITIFSSNMVRIQYGQNLYDSLEDATSMLSLETYVTETNIDENGLLRGFLIVKSGTTDLSNSFDARFLNASRFGIASETNVGAGVYRTDLLNDASTGLRAGGVLSVNGADNTKFDVSAGSGRVIDNITDSLNPVLKQVNWDAFTAETIPNLLTQVLTFIAIDSTGSIVKQSADFTPSEYRNLIVLGRIVHIDKSTVTNTTSLSVPIIDPLLTTVDMALAVGSINTSGNVFSFQGGNLLLDKTAGSQFRIGSNKKLSDDNPSITTQALGTGVIFIPAYRDGSGGVSIGAPTDSINPNKYDDGTGTLASVPNNKYTSQRVFHFSSNIIVVVYGQIVYNNLSDAVDGIFTDSFVTFGVEGSINRAAIAVKQGTTDLSVTTKATIIEGTKFGEFNGGGGGGGSASTLQQIYDNSTPNPEILTSITNKAFTLRRGSSSDSDNIFEGQNNAGSTTLSISGNGDIVANNYNNLNWDTAFGWGNHAGLYSLLGHTHTFASLTSKPTTISGYGITDAFTKTESDAKFEILVDKGQANGYAPLDSSGKLPTTHLPALAISDTFVVATEAAMLLLTAETGDVAVRTDENKSYILQGTDPTLLTDWQELLTPTDAVQTVNGLNGTVILDLTFNNGDLSITGGNSVDLDLRYSILGHTHTFASLTSKPTTIGGYGITDFVSLGDVEWMQIGQQLAVTKSLISGEFFTSYDSSTGLFTSAQASYTDLSNIPTSFAPSVHAHGSYDRPTSILSGANVFSDIVVTDGIVGTIATRAMTLSDLGYTGATDANKYVHPNHTGDVTSVADGATTIVNKKVTLAKMADMATASIIGRNTATTGIPEILSAATVRTIINVADGATIDQTSIVGISGTKSQFNTELSNGNFMFIGDDPTAHTHTFASLTSKPTTIGGYGITDFNSLGDARWLGLTAKAADSNLLDGVDSGQFLRKDSFNGGATGSIQFNDNFSISFGDVGDMTIKHSGGNNLIDMLSGNLIIRDNTTTRFTFGRTTGNFTLTGQLISSVAQNNGVVFESSAFINKTSATTNTTGVSTIALRTSVAANQGYSMSALRRDTSANADMIWKNHDNSSAGVETMRLTKEGNLTIRNSNDAIITIISNITGNSEIWFGDTDDQNIGRIRYEHASNKLEFWINNAERASISNTGNFVTSGTSTATNFIGNWSGLNSGQFLRSDENTTKTGGNLTMKDGLKILFGTSSDMQISHEGAIPENRIRLNNGNLVINDTGTTRFTFGRTTGNFTATGDVTANGNLVTPGTLRVGGTSDSWVLGEFGLGTTAPSSKLHLFQNANSKIQIKIQNDNTGLSATSAINILSQGNNFTIENFGDGTSKANVTELGSTATGSVLSFLTANVERMTIFDKGLRIGGFISGHTGSGAKLQVNGFMRVGSIYIHEGGTGTILTAGLELGNLAGVLRWNGSPIITGNNANSELGQFLRSDVADNKTAGELKFFDNVILRFGSSASGSNFKFDGTNTIHTLLVGDLIVKDNTNTRFTFGKTSGNFTATGTMTATNFILSSDKRLKTKITPVIKSNRIHTEWVNFELKSELGQNRYGVIAQELEIHHPEFIRTGENGEKSVAYIDLLIAKNIELEDKLDNMEARMLKMEELIKTLI